MNANNQFSLRVPVGEDTAEMLVLGGKAGEYPWGYEEFPETPQSLGKGDNGQALHTFSCGGVTVDYRSIPREDDSCYVYRMTTDQPGVATDAGVQVGDTEEAAQAAYPGAVPLGAVGEWLLGADYALIYEPGGYADCKHIALYVKDGVVAQIEIEDLMDGRLLS